MLKPGGVLVLADSIQLGDRPHVDRHLGRFGDFNEPYYRSYIREELVALFGPDGAGLEPWTKELCSSTKVVSFRKPRARETSARIPRIPRGVKSRASVPAPIPDGPRRHARERS